MTQTLDALIIGAGPAGSFLAYKLARVGLKTLVLDKAIKPKRKVCGEYLCPQGVELLKKEGLEHEVLGEFLPLQGMLIVSPKGKVVDSRFPFPNQFHGVAVNREEFDTNLIRVAVRSGAEVLHGTEILQILQSGEFWVLKTNRGEYRARILIGADGRNSMVSRYFKNDVALPARRVALHALVNSTSENLRRGEMHLFGDSAYVGLNPTGEQEVNFSLVLNSDRLKTLGGPLPALNYYLNQSSNLRSRFSNFTDPHEIAAAFPIQHRTKSIVPHPKVALIGDAAGFIDPLTGEGMYNALLSAQILGDCIAKDIKYNLFVTSKGLYEYQHKYSRHMRHKTLLNRGFQWLIRFPFLLEVAAAFLSKNQRRSDIFIGIIGNIFSPLSGIQKLIFNHRSIG